MPMMAVICGMPIADMTALLRKMRPKSSWSGKTSSCKRQEDAGRVDEVEGGDAVLHRDVLSAENLLRGHGEEGAGLHGRVVGDDHAELSGDAAEAGDGAGGRCSAPLFVHFEGGEEGEFEELGVGIKKKR